MQSSADHAIRTVLDNVHPEALCLHAYAFLLELCGIPLCLHVPSFKQLTQCIHLDCSLLGLFSLSFMAPVFAYACCAGLTEHHHGRVKQLTQLTNELSCPRVVFHVQIGCSKRVSNTSSTFLRVPISLLRAFASLFRPSILYTAARRTRKCSESPYRLTNTNDSLCVTPGMTMRWESTPSLHALSSSMTLSTRPGSAYLRFWDSLMRSGFPPLPVQRPSTTRTAA